MGFADYFDKNAQAACLLLQGMDADAFKAVLAKEIIGIAFDKACASAEGSASMDLTIRLLARLYPSLALIPLDHYAKKKLSTYKGLARAINPRITLQGNIKGVTRCLVVGNSNLPQPRKNRPFTIYIGSDNWIAKLSVKAPVGSGSSTNPFGAGAAACFGVANVFRKSFAAQLPTAKPDSQICFSVLEMSAVTQKPKNPVLREVNIGELHLVGAGAVGNGLLWAMARLNGRGTLHVVDPERLDRTNLQRYAMTTPKDEGDLKAQLGKQWLSKRKLSVHAHGVSWESYVMSRNNWKFERVAVAVDTAETRINVQAALPRRVFNSWTQVGEVGLSRHTFLGDEACLACLYIPTEKKLNFDQIIARALHLSEDEMQLMDIRRRLDLAVPTERSFLERVALASSIPIECLLPFEGRLLRDFYVEAVCGGAVIEFGTPTSGLRAEVPMAFQSALSGILLAADVIACAARLRPTLPTITQVDLLNALPNICSHVRRKQADTKCFCADEDFKDVYRAKYELSEATGT